MNRRAFFGRVLPVAAAGAVPVAAAVPQKTALAIDEVYCPCGCQLNHVPTEQDRQMFGGHNEALLAPRQLTCFDCGRTHVVTAARYR